MGEAGRKGHFDIVVELLMRGGRADARDGLGYSALHWASHWGNVEVVKALLAAGADPYAVTTEISDKYTPLHFAAVANKAAVIGPLINACPAALHARSVQGWTPRATAVASGSDAAVKAVALAGCMGCGKLRSEVVGGGGKLRLCSLCRTIAYCSTAEPPLE